MWKRRRTARWFDSPTDRQHGSWHDRPSVVMACRNTAFVMSDSCFLLLLLFLVPDKRQAVAKKLFVNIFLPFSLAPDLKKDAVTACLFVWFLSALALLTVLQQSVRPQPNKSRFRPLWFMKFFPLLTVCPFLSLQTKRWVSPAEQYWCWTGEFPIYSLSTAAAVAVQIFWVFFPQFFLVIFVDCVYMDLSMWVIFEFFKHPVFCFFM